MDRSLSKLQTSLALRHGANRLPLRSGIDVGPVSDMGRDGSESGDNMANASNRNRGVDLGVMRSANRSLVLELIKGAGPVSRAAIAKGTQLAKPTVSAIVDVLISDGLVKEVGFERTSSGGAGRPSAMLAFNAESKYVVGLHIGVAKTIVSLADASGREIGRVDEGTPPGAPDDSLRAIAGLVNGLLVTHGIGRRRLAGLGVCLPGLVDLHRGSCLLAPNLGWRDVPVRDTLKREVGVDVFVHNTVQAAAVAEDVEGAGRGAGDVVYIYSGLGVGGGALQGGRIVHGTAGTAGEIGHCVVPGAADRCACGMIGCLETVASAPAVARAAQKAIIAGRSSRLEAIGGEITPPDVSAAAHAGDALAIEILANAGRSLGIAASWLVNVLNPRVLVIGGGLIGAGDFVLAPFHAAVREHTLPQALEPLSIRPWALGRDSKVRGAVLLALQNANQYYRVVFGS